jgi:hypothetical protein
MYPSMCAIRKNKGGKSHDGKGSKGICNGGVMSMHYDSAVLPKRAHFDEKLF